MENHISNLLDKMSEVSQPQRKFMVTLWLTILLLRGKVNFLNLSRYSELNEKTYRRHFQQSFDFTTFNHHLITEAVPSSHEQIGVMDGSYLPKSGKKTYRLDMFYDSSHNHPAKGLELSNLAVVDVTTGSGYTLSCRQTPPQEEIEQLFAQRLSKNANSAQNPTLGGENWFKSGLKFKLSAQNSTLSSQNRFRSGLESSVFCGRWHLRSIPGNF